MIDIETKRNARITLLDMAERARRAGLSVSQWEERASQIPEGQLVGEREIGAIGSYIFITRRR